MSCEIDTYCDTTVGKFMNIFQKLASAVIALSFLVTGHAQEQNDWENPTITQINKEPAHATFVPFASIARASMDKAQSPFCKSLNGRWKF
ncbi:MAG: hypothetical protein HQL32_14755, partial [Planctomycetes bacterium]|nr:hypothetical protein [Planctomycetota bacterium]